VCLDFIYFPSVVSALLLKFFYRPLLRFVALDEDGFCRSFAVLRIQVFTENVLLAPGHIALLTLELAVLLLPSRGEFRPGDEVPAVYLLVVPQTTARVAISPTFFVGSTQADELREDGIKSLFRLRYSHSFPVSKKGCSSFSKRALPLLHRTRGRS